MLDEPTNHLDLSSKDELEKALNDYAGAVIFSSHDRFLLDRLATRRIIHRNKAARKKSQLARMLNQKKAP